MPEWRPIAPAYDAAMAMIVRRSLAAHGLDVPGTAYFDASLDHLSEFYDRPGRGYWVLLEQGTVVGGVGVAEFEDLEGCGELQKLYLAESARGRGLGYEMIRRVETEAWALGYRRMYLETHTNLAAAIHEYERSGYRRIAPPVSAVHSAMDRFYLKELRSPSY